MVGGYGISTFAGYLIPNPFYTNKQFSFKQFSISTQFNSRQKICFQVICFRQTVLSFKKSV